ncbi:alternative ribosome rescue aminoacyl-tRNA hydrolase ArfB [Nocardioides daeguensis]|uniref:Alternative ribosome rescue aminoacyl-tRNA hydrolase ArfB n=1 Tax=Nocardioides daeguensis TaxID=908359 RepID=A0ABP6UWY9_9ACTN|nr:alternative ribosome rescue aminoacyl-tRNA hydrolase ArfB [Nocardioides daeguensis]MBV6725803.1 aminoacyl-tRNA hydrolase [Nocardioides daeguensis]MCR1772682.1 aminoacyl-tRNA hydrolase [Nocardioides daeguensis]
MALNDLSVPPGPGLPAGLLIPDTELVERFSRSPGPGGQSVNTTDSRVELVWDPAASTVLTEAQRTRLLARVAGPISVVAHEHRSQHRNRVAARERLAARVRELLAPPPPTRRATKPTRGSKERRLDAKRRRGQTKQLRGRIDD